MLKVLGVGLGRTGTRSTRQALEHLGLGQCHHMSALIGNQKLAQKWYDAVFHNKTNWDYIFDGYQASVDWPAVSYWRELADHYPNAKVLLNTRDSESWYASMSKTVFKQLETPLGEEGSDLWLRRTITNKLIREDLFSGRGASDKAHAISVFEKHNAEIQASFDSDRLLVWEVSEGWEPLCEFLDLPVPNKSFPHLNSTANFSKMLAGEVPSDDDKVLLDFACF